MIQSNLVRYLILGLCSIILSLSVLNLLPGIVTNIFSTIGLIISPDSQPMAGLYIIGGIIGIPVFTSFLIVSALPLFFLLKRWRFEKPIVQVVLSQVILLAASTTITAATPKTTSDINPICLALGILTTYAASIFCLVLSNTIILYFKKPPVIQTR